MKKQKSSKRKLVDLQPSLINDTKNEHYVNTIDYGDFIYVPDDSHKYIEEANPFMTLENFPDEFYFSSESLFAELIKELEVQISGISRYNKSNPYNVLEELTRYLNLINLLKKMGGLFSDRELLALHFCISTYASECGSNERKKEIRRTMFLIREELRSHEIDFERFSNKVDALDNLELFELTEVLINSKVSNLAIWDYQIISETFTPNASLEKFHKKLSVYQIEKSLKGLLGKSPKEIWDDKYDSVPSKIINYINNVPEFKRQIDEFEEKDPNFNFRKKFSLSLYTYMDRFKSAEKSKGNRYDQLNNPNNNNEENDLNKSRLKVKTLISEFISSESTKVKNREIGYYSEGIRFNEKSHNFAFKHDYSLVCPDDAMANFESIVFEKQNWDLIVHYYRDYIKVFPIQIKEFEKTLFLFLLRAALKNIPSGINYVGHLLDLKKQVNILLNAKYIHVDNESVLLFLHIVNVDPELKQMRDEIFKEFEELLDFHRCCRTKVRITSDIPADGEG